MDCLWLELTQLNCPHLFPGGVWEVQELTKYLCIFLHERFWIWIDSWQSFNMPTVKPKQNQTVTRVCQRWTKSEWLNLQMQIVFFEKQLWCSTVENTARCGCNGHLNARCATKALDKTLNTTFCVVNNLKMTPDPKPPDYSKAWSHFFPSKPEYTCWWVIGRLTQTHLGSVDVIYYLSTTARPMYMYKNTQP